MNTTKSILVAVDDDDSMGEAIKAGLSLASSLNAPLEIVHALGLPSVDDVDARSSLRLTAMRGEMLQRRRASLEARLQPLCTPYGRSVDELIRIKEGPITQAVLTQAEESDARLLVLGPHRRLAMFDWGSHARAILAAAPCDLWVQATPWREVKRILVPVDLSEHSLAALEVAFDLASELGAAVTCMHAWFPPEVYAGFMGEFPISGFGDTLDSFRGAAEKEFRETLESLQRDDVTLDLQFVEGRAVPSILEHQGSVDLIALGSHGRTGFAAAVLGNTAYSVLTRATCSVLAVRHPERSFLR